MYMQILSEMLTAQPLNLFKNHIRTNICQTWSFSLIFQFYPIIYIQKLFYHSFLCYLPKVLKFFCIYNSVQLCIPRHFFPLCVHQGPNSQSLTGGIKSTTLCHSRPYPQERYQEFNYRSSTLLSGRLRGLQDDGEKTWDFS